MEHTILTITGLAILLPFLVLISITPGMCMMLSLTLAISVGFKRTLMMMVGELIGVAIIVVLSILGAAAIMLQYPDLFTVFKLIGGAYLCYLGIQLWLSKGKMSLNDDWQQSNNHNNLQGS